MNHKRIYRLYRERGLSVRTKRRRKLAAHLRTVPPAPTRANERWSADFVSDTLADGRSFRIFTLVEVFTRESLATEVATSFPAESVTRVLHRVIARRGKPAVLTTDNGTEFTSRHFDAWAYRHQIALDFIHPGRPVENCHVESFNGRLRDECLNTSWFEGLEEARSSIEAWRLDYNEVRPHSSLADLCPAVFAAGQSP